MALFKGNGIPWGPEFPLNHSKSETDTEVQARIEKRAAAQPDLITGKITEEDLKEKPLIKDLHYDRKTGGSTLGGKFKLNDTASYPGTIPEIDSYVKDFDQPIQGQSNFPELRKMTGDWTTNFYGPSQCEGCGEHDIVRTGGGRFESVRSWREHNAHGTSYEAHHCTHLSLFKSLAGKVLTVIDASLTTNSKQHKAVCDLLRKAFAETISKARELEGDHGNESTGEGLA